jgi:hypothetical protein
LTATQCSYAVPPGAEAGRVVPHLPVTASMMVALLEITAGALTRTDAARVRLIIMLLFLNCLRRDELFTPTTKAFDKIVHLCRDDIKVDFATGGLCLMFRIKQSRTDPISQWMNGWVPQHSRISIGLCACLHVVVNVLRGYSWYWQCKPTVYRQRWSSSFTC